MKGVSGVHLMLVEWEHMVPLLAEKAGLLPRPEV
jgi:methylenetetrahydrofolate reductase (NADPH)